VNLADSGRTVNVLYRPPERTRGSVMMPLVLKTNTGEFVKLVLRAFILALHMPHPMFISWASLVELKPQWAITEDKKTFIHLETEQEKLNFLGL